MTTPSAPDSLHFAITSAAGAEQIIVSDMSPEEAMGLQRSVDTLRRAAATL